mgnify:CR=1 FL=1|jgi:hypothetical protein
MLTNWRYSTVTSQATTDAGAGTPLLTTGIKPRLVTLLACYWGTNTTGSINMRWFIVPETSISPTSSGQYTLDDEAFPVGFCSADMDGATPNILNPIVGIGIGAKGQSNETLMMPPNSLLIAAPAIAQNGTVVHKVISAEIEE